MRNTINTSGPRRYLSLSDKEILKRAERLMTKEKRYLDPYLTLDALAAEIQISRNVLSRVINTLTGSHFHEWLWRYRIGETRRLVGQKNGDKLSVNEMARLSGFSNRTSFFRVCRKMTGKAQKEKTQKHISKK